MIKLKGISRLYKIGQVKVTALNEIDLSIEEGEFVTIMGPSGSGKSTLLNIIGCLDRPSAGTYELSQKRVEKLSDSALADIRNKYIGFVFQRFHLMPALDALGNVQLPLIYRGVFGRERRKRAKAALEMVGLADRMHHTPSQLSGGEQQRVAIARAIVVEPTVILADEPTGSLDSKSGSNIMSIFRNLNREQGITIVQVTHSEEMAQYGSKVVRILDGQIERIDKVG
ncbi:MAG TPA: ABC transporter ATP-binding protein [Clostridiaceae bacterium]|nr:ABC transporter ATP-binding protein [Clostridiaceae bacterium]